MSYDARTNQRDCLRDGKPEITAITVAISLTVTQTTDYSGGGGDITVLTQTTSASHTFGRRFLTEFKNKFFANNIEYSDDLTWQGLPNPLCSEVFWKASEGIGDYGLTVLFPEPWTPSAFVDYETRDAEINAHAIYKHGEFLLLAPRCCPCALRLYHRPITITDATETTYTVNGTPDDLPWPYTEFSDFTLRLPELFSHYCKTELPIWAGPVIASEYPDPDEPVTLTVEIETQGAEGVDAEITITPDQDGIVQVAKDFTWLSPQGVTYLFTLSIGFRSYSGSVAWPAHWAFQDFTYPDSSYPAVNFHIVKVTDDEHDETAYEYQLRTGINPHRDFQITYATKADGNSGAVRVGFIGKFAETEVNTFVPSSPYHDGEIYERARVLPAEPLPADKIRAGNVPEYLNDGGYEDHPDWREVARCMSDGGSSWSRSFSNSETSNSGYTVTTRVGNITYSW